MKRKYFDVRDWEMITEKRCQIKEISTEEFKGIISLLNIDGVVKPEIWSFGGHDFAIYDKGVEWFRMMPENKSGQPANYNITTIFGADKKIIMWYIDIIKDYAYDENGDLYFDDLYLDLVALPNGIVKVKDMDDLQRALTNGEIDAELFQAAVSVKDELVNNVLSNIEKFRELTVKLRKEFD